MRVLRVEDEVRLAETLRDLLEQERYTADLFMTGKAVWITLCPTSMIW